MLIQIVYHFFVPRYYPCSNQPILNNFLSGPSWTRKDLRLEATTPGGNVNVWSRTEDSGELLPAAYDPVGVMDLSQSDNLHATPSLRLVSAAVEGLVLCRYFEKAGLNFSGKKVIELGSGTGLVGILATLLGGDVTLTDLPMVLNQVEENVAKNIPSTMMQRSKVSALQWGEDHGNFTSDYDVILGSGVVYYRRHFQFLIDTLLYLSNEGTVIYLSSSMCHDTGAIDFHENIVPQHFNSEIVDRIDSKDVSVFKITRKHTTFQ
ncbi:EEF1A lysine methyltransferase 3-like [Hemitrygon akajei]|uniref:EEF1A lysine methyltransferase 3-like n=1 Tax=Hemitrygon akajei TaxID=2704970 RepID=UPI003BFA15B6